ncbi:protein-S-isoprenylcysteine O-methyltransferase Ste14/predicted DCC family thiol-disulfide oxidoreductase YuxK [Catenuloplanes atrovinosus]|uniref:Protein-S-isoprenylcysteine O-methyltransferase Ste14/predicted DCC family thiol-disulfide oxidoreductase YuxK n=1 Tax=Catenuloplanes atrovinosus TaxID=137266 RepID=A0AAE3YWC0_9ACTN|nr:protein-S-isoprenylcysteine O-methyltransferase Ste14/predicted DCC family thiol-disulfide oxidoreductase YuxK [Catenuloplanes atrovinosus]
MSAPDLVLARYATVLVPLVLVLIGLRVERTRDGRAAALLAGISAAVGISALDPVARTAGWWSFAPVDGAFHGMPVDLWLGWAALWGALPVLFRRVLPWPLTVPLLAWLDLIAMPRLAPLLVLGERWWIGELIGAAGVMLPSVLLGVAVAERRWLTARVLGQLVVFAGLTLWLFPRVAFTFDGATWPREHLAVWAQLALLLSIPALLAVREFATRGRGTAYPWDPPDRLITTGPYAYVANPMQLSVVALMLLLAVAAGSWAMVVAAVVAVAFSAAVAEPHERAALAARHGDEWRAYRRRVRDWWPRWTPYVDGPEPVLWLDADCGPCAATAAFLRDRRPHGLVVAPAGEHPGVIWRAEYAGAGGHVAHGVAAVARGLEHLHLGWAYTGWFLRLPGVDAVAQAVVDAFVAPPHPAGTVDGSHEWRPDVGHQAEAAGRHAHRRH